MAGDTVLVVDDNLINLKLIKVLLTSEGYVVATATDAVTALKILETAKPRLILMDIQLPGMDGLDLTKKLKSDPKTKDILIIALTAYAMKGDEEKALQAGCNGYVTKPLDVIQLREKIKSLIGF